MFSSCSFLQDNVFVRMGIQMIAQHRRVSSTLKQQMDFTSRTLLLSGGAPSSVLRCCACFSHAGLCMPTLSSPFQLSLQCHQAGLTL